MDCSLSSSVKRQYEAWMHSPSVFSSIPSETILAFKISRELHLPPSKVLKALRGVTDLDPALLQAVERYVKENPTLDFQGNSPTRLIVLT